MGHYASEMGFKEPQHPAEEAGFRRENYAGLFECLTCGAVVRGWQLHLAWHEEHDGRQ